MAAKMAKVEVRLIKGEGTPECTWSIYEKIPGVGWGLLGSASEPVSLTNSQAALESQLDTLLPDNAAAE